MNAWKLAPAALIALLLLAPAAGGERRTLSLLSDGPFAADPELVTSFWGMSRDGSRVFTFTREALAGTDTDAADDAYAYTGDGAPVHLTDNPSGPRPAGRRVRRGHLA